MPDEINHRAFCSGDVLLSHGLSPYYHRGCSVSLPCSEWERVVPLRYYHQRLTPKAFGANLWCVIRISRFVTSDFSQCTIRDLTIHVKVSKNRRFSDIYIQEVSKNNFG